VKENLVIRFKKLARILNAVTDFRANLKKVTIAPISFSFAGRGETRKLIGAMKSGAEIAIRATAGTRLL
jgi:hypothetical protein